MKNKDKGHEPPASQKNPSGVAAKRAEALQEPTTWPVENLLPKSVREDDRLIRVLVDTLRARGYEITKLESGFGMKASDAQRARGEIAGIKKLQGAWSAADDKAAKVTRVSNPASSTGAEAVDEDDEDLSDELDGDELLDSDEDAEERDEDEEDDDEDD